MTNLKEHQTFTSLNELYEALSLHVSFRKGELNSTVLDVLEVLRENGEEYPGVAHLKIATISRKIGKSRRTAQRALRKLEDLQIINRQPVIRETSGAQDANIYIILDTSDRRDLL